MNLLSGTIVLFNSILSVKYLFDISYIRGIKIEKEEKVDKKKIVQTSILAFICSFIMTIFGYLKNCIFLEVENRISGVQQFLTFIVIMGFIILFTSEKDIYTLTKKFKYDKYLINTRFIILISILATLINTFLIYII